MRGGALIFAVLLGATMADITYPPEAKMPPAIEEVDEVLYQMPGYQCSTDSDCLAYCSFIEQRECTDEDIFGPSCEQGPDGECVPE